VPFLNVDDKFAFHPKVVVARNEAVGAFVRMAAWSQDHGTDGAVPSEIAILIAERDEVLERLVDSRLLEKRMGGGWQLHDFLDWNLSAKQAKARAKQKRLAGLRGAEKRWQKDSTCHSPAMAPAMAPAIENGWVGDATGVARARAPQPHPQPHIQNTTPTPPENGTKPAKALRRKKAATPLPADWEPSPELYEWARTDPGVRLPAEFVERVFAEFRSYWLGEGKAKVSWEETFKNRLRDQRERHPRWPVADDRPPVTPPDTPPPRAEILANQVPPGSTIQDLFAGFGAKEG
jgi:hypothetical protein